MNNTNNFYGNVTGVQIQQGTVNSDQKQNFLEEFDYEKVFQIIRKIKKYDPMFDEEYGQLASEMRDKLSEIEKLLKERGCSRQRYCFWYCRLIANGLGGIRYGNNN